MRGIYEMITLAFNRIRICTVSETLFFVYRGDRGDYGAKGPKGEKGAPGAPGVDGADGSPGIQGSVGEFIILFSHMWWWNLIFLKNS